jgi:hypothetical protein
MAKASLQVRNVKATALNALSSSITPARGLGNAIFGPFQSADNLL